MSNVPIRVVDFGGDLGAALRTGCFNVYRYLGVCGLSRQIQSLSTPFFQLLQQAYASACDGRCLAKVAVDENMLGLYTYMCTIQA